MTGIIEEGEEPERGAAWEGMAVGMVKLTGSAAVVDPNELADRLRFMGIAEDVVVGFEDRHRSDAERALEWLAGMLDDLDEPMSWTCDCGALLVDANWRGREVVRCSDCGARWALEVATADFGSQSLISPPHQDWLDRRAREEELRNGDYPPRTSPPPRPPTDERHHRAGRLATPGHLD